ncbi:MAG TPA: ATP-binding protein [Noviherbaspirillum sp.]|nr:ATP-binding protein [Noviherbaspirillum sp.]
MDHFSASRISPFIVDPAQTDSDVMHLMYGLDWSTTNVSHPAEWPVSLQIYVRNMLSSGFPILTLWGPDLACLYNDAYIAFLGDKHPAAFGKPFKEIWPEIIQDVEPILHKALSGHSSYFEDMPFSIIRNGQRDIVWVTFNYAPAYGDDGTIMGMHSVLIDTTNRVMAEKRKAFQLQMADSLRELSEPNEIMEVASRLTGEYLAAGRVGYSEIDEEKGMASVYLDWTNGMLFTLAGESRPLDSFGPAIISELRHGNTLQINDVYLHPKSMHYAEGYASIGARAVLVAPLLEANGLTAAFHVHEAAPRNWTDEEVALVEDVAKRTWDAVRRARVEKALRDETRILEILNKTGQLLASTLNLSDLLQSITDAGTQLVGAKYGAFFYNNIDANGETYMLYTLSGAPREAFEKFGYPRATQVFRPTLHGAKPLRSDDITTDPRYGQMAPHHGMPEGHLPVRSYLAASVISRNGEVIGGLFFGHPDAGVFNEKAERIIEGVAAQAAIAIDNARLYDVAQKSALERQVLLSSERAARAEAERLIRAKDEFLAMLAHELRNPLAPVSAAAQMLKLAPNDEPRVRQASAIISRQVVHMTHLIDDLMDVSRVTRGLIQLEKETLDIRSIIASAIEQARPLIEARRHILGTQIDAERAFVHGDRTRLVQVVTNLLNNAAKYTPAGGEIGLRVETADKQVRVSVTDNGNGMDSSLVPHVFDLFTQGTRDLDRSQGGLGIGLALVKAIVALHEGHISAASEGLGKGSTFTVSLPQAEIVTVRSENGESLYDVDVLHIMVVDDNADAAHSLAVLLQALGHFVTVKTNARDALDDAVLNPPDAFILDIGLPDISGYDLAKLLRARAECSHAMLIALTGYGQPQDRDMSQAAGFDHHLVKPADTQVIMKILADARRTSTPQRSPEQQSRHNAG